MAKLRNIGPGAYVSGSLSVLKGEVVEVPAERAKYLLSDDCPGTFEEVKVEAPKLAAAAPKKPAA